MKVGRVSPLTNELVTRELNITAEQYKAWLDGELIQNAMPQLTGEEREFVLSGCSAAEWGRLFPEDEEEGPPWEDDDAF